MKKVLLIGSGVSSLITAALLSKKGHHVTVLEAHTKPGGYLHCFTRFGIRFDTGAHYVGALDQGQPFWAILKYLGIDSSQIFVPLDPNGFDVIRAPGVQFAFPKGYDAVISKLSAEYPQEREGIKKFFSLIESTAEIFPTYHFQTSLTGLEKSLIAALDTPLKKIVDDCVSDPKLSFLLQVHCTLHGVAPSDVSLGLHSLMMDSMITGPYGFARGGDGLAEALVSVIEQNGGRVLLKKRATQIKVKNHMAVSVTTEDGEEFPADELISGIHPKTTLSLCSDQSSFTQAFKDRLKSLKETLPYFGLYVEPDLSPMLRETFKPNQNYYYLSTIDPEAPWTHKHKPMDPVGAFISFSDRVQYGGMHIIGAGPYDWFSPFKGSLPKTRPEAYKDLKLSAQNSLLGLIDKFHPEVASGVSKTFKRIVSSSALTNIHFTGSPEGSAHGLYHSMEVTGIRALGPRTKIANLLLTGQNTLFPGILGSTISGLRTAGHLVGIKPLISELMKQ